ncbi:hypothetical protein T11_17328, partial [Trichinella zimbabwensis]
MRNIFGCRWTPGGTGKMRKTTFSIFEKCATFLAVAGPQEAREK